MNACVAPVAGVRPAPPLFHCSLKFSREEEGPGKGKRSDGEVAGTGAELEKNTKMCFDGFCLFLVKPIHSIKRGRNRFGIFKEAPESSWKPK